MSKIAAAAHAPFIAGGSPTLMQMDSWQELSNPRDLTKIFQTAEYAPWRSLRESEDARYLGLAMPRFLSRLPYGAKTDPVTDFDFEEDVEGADHTKYTWANAAYAMATNINRSFKMYGWCTRIRGIESGGAVEGLPCHTFPTDDGGVEMKCPTEIAISDRREAELAKNGFMPLVHRKNTDFAAFIGAQSLQKPAEYDDPDATANANLAARLPYLFATCRFAHYLKCIVRDKIGSFKEKDEMAGLAQQMDLQLRRAQPKLASEEDKARRPLAEAEVELRRDEGNPGYYTSKFFLRPTISSKASRSRCGWCRSCHRQRAAGRDSPSREQTCSRWPRANGNSPGPGLVPANGCCNDSRSVRRLYRRTRGCKNTR